MDGRELSGDGGTAMLEGVFGSMSAFSLRGLRFDNVDGLGAVPAMRNIANQGVLAAMTPRMFLSLVPDLDPADRRATLDVLDRTSSPLGSPFLAFRLSLDTDELSVRQHEGTHRMMWIAREYGPDVEIPVGILLQEDHYQLRAREIEPDLVSRVSHGAYREKSRTFVDGPLFSGAVWAGGRFGMKKTESTPVSSRTM